MKGGETPSFRNRSKNFELALVLASTVPFALVVLNNWSQTQPSSSLMLATIVSLIVVLNMIHVPSTLYLYTDPLIRARTRREPVRLALIPLLLWFSTAAAFYAASSFATSLHTTALLLMILFYLHWQAWHFGMQSYGVHSFVSITARRPKREAWQAKLEKKLVMWGTIFGMMAVYVQLGGHAWFLNLPHLDYALYQRIFGVAFEIGRWGCYAVSLAALIYVLRYRALFTRNSAVIFMISVCFFLPDYLAFMPPSSTPGSFVSLLNFTLVHGIQYLVFMVAHVTGQVRQRKAEQALGHRKKGTLDPWIMFFLIAVLLGLVINDATKLSAFGSSVLTALAISFSQHTLTLTFIGFSFGLTMAHFWVDQYVWKLSQPEPRAWVGDRFAHVLPPKEARA